MTDLIVLCADKKIQMTLETLLRRHAALGIRKVSFKVEVMVGKYDHGCFQNAHGYLKPRREEFGHALVVFDKQWDGAPALSATGMEDEVRKALRPDWGQDCGVIVIDPELEAWVWSDSPHVDEILGWKDRKPALREWLVQKRFLASGQVKPGDPKLAVEQAVLAVQRRWTAGTCKTLAAKVGLGRCTDDSFGRLKDVLVAWFGRGGKP